MSNIHEEEKLEKSYDGRLMRRLLGYVKPYKYWMLLSIILLLLITVSDLARPYLIKVAIDDHMNVFHTEFVASSPAELPDEEHYSFQGQVLVRESDFETPPADRERYRIETAAQDQYVMVVENATGAETNRIPMSAAEVDLFKDTEIDALVAIGLIYLALILGSFVLNYVQTIVLQWTGQRIIFNIRQQLFSHLQKLSLAFFDRNPVGRLVTRVMNDTEALNEMYSNMLVTLFKDVFLLLGIILIMFQTNVKLALISMACVPFVIIVSQIYRHYARVAFRDTRVKLAQINATLAENISGMRIIQIFRQEKRMHQEFEKTNDEYFKASWQELKTFAIFRPSMELFAQLALAILIWYGGGKVLDNALQIGVLYMFINYTQQFFQPINDLSEKYNILQSAMASSERLFQLLDTDDMIKNPAQPQPFPNIKGRVEFKNVWFAYSGENWVLRDVSFTIEPGETVAFVGATGAGKSSILNLLSRFYDIQKGEILIDGVNIKDVRKEDLRRAISVVLQDVFLFTGTIRDNVRLQEPSITDRQIEEAVRFVNADKLINKLPGKLDEPVLERGATFSAGERQLIAFARALAFDPKILVLDEATANIDTETESLIQDALQKLTQDRTTIVVAHRLSTIQNADKIIVMHKGTIREMGNHQALLAQGGMYYNLYQLQYKEDFEHEAAAALSPAEA
ncbi:ATP-binding cassette subfamily B protein/subfamily B ATP-binding cassette protein MsbA [Tumebacillus sp. BK434]|uniref:ABC transporter ATP-binding protein n=1 Tax=Tumebacillus sp. BK434 TaxID=2512169 RepID=UPI00104488AD|nr:ABC transporter ATP-binding protein [Tumebacillus sp. BK434]TCP54689.1 ATP-binding cassette subfamily B protein/subfamily B ATP-binding cassette protein MsbA [Tumebacillus sp. BK434]